jgi:16S rRNA processing protein RimM
MESSHRPDISCDPEGLGVPDSGNSEARAPSSGVASHVLEGSAAPGLLGGQPWVLIARLVRPHGRRGELVAEILTDFPERFHQRSHLFLLPPERVGSRARPVRLENFWFLRSRIVLKFQGIDSINEAESLRGFEIAIPLAERAPLEAGSIYLGDLIGCRVYDLNRQGVEVGEIADVDRESSNTELLVIRRRDSPHPDNEVLIPFVKEYLVRMDAAHRRVEMRLPEGLIDINAPVTEQEKQETKQAKDGGRHVPGPAES